MHEASSIPMPNQSAPSTADAVRGLARFLRTVRRRRNHLLAALLLSALLGGLYYSTATRVYRATASVMVLQAGGEVWDPSMGRDRSPADLIPTLEKLFSQSVVVEAAVERIAKLPPELQVDFAPHHRDDWPGILRANLSTRSVRQTKLIELSYSSLDPRAAEAVLQAVVDSYMEFMNQQHHDGSVESVAILDDERKDVASELVEKQERFRQLSRAAQSLGLRNHQSVVHPSIARVIALNDAMTSARTERLQLEASLAGIEAAARQRRDLRPHLVSLEPVLGRDLVNDILGLDPESREAVNSLSEKLLRDRARLDALREHLLDRHPEIVQLQQEITNTEIYLAELQMRQGGHAPLAADSPTGRMLQSVIEGKLAETRAYERELTVQYEAAAQDAARLEDHMVELSLLDHDIQLLRNLHDTLANRIADLGIRQNRSDVRMAVVSDPAASDAAVSPRLLLVIAGCLLIGLAGGVASVYVVDLLDDRFRSPQELSEQLGLPVLGVIPKLQEFGTGIDAVGVHAAPHAPECESFHTLRTTLSLTAAESQRLAITSSEPSDGKTTVLANLAASMSQAGRRVLLIDADMRRPGLRRLFDYPLTEGLSDVLREEIEFSESCAPRIRPTGIDRLDILPAGPKPADPADLLNRPRFADLIGWAETSYDHVLIDCPPALVAADAAVVGRVVENMLLLVQPDKNHRRVVLRAAESLLGLNVPVIGVVVNNVASEGQEEYYGYGSYGYGYGHDAAAHDDAAGGEPPVTGIARAA